MFKLFCSETRAFRACYYVSIIIYYNIFCWNFECNVRLNAELIASFMIATLATLSNNDLHDSRIAGCWSCCKSSLSDIIRYDKVCARRRRYELKTCQSERTCVCLLFFFFFTRHIFIRPTKQRKSEKKTTKRQERTRHGKRWNIVPTLFFRVFESFLTIRTLAQSELHRSTERM